MTFTLKNLDEAIDEQKQTSIITSIIEPLDFVLYRNDSRSLDELDK